MTAILISREKLDYVSRQTNKPIKGWKFHFLKDKRNPSDTFKGYEVGDGFLNESDANNAPLINELVHIVPGSRMELTYECDGRINFLTAIAGIDLVFDFSEPIKTVKGDDFIAI